MTQYPPGCARAGGGWGADNHWQAPHSQRASAAGLAPRESDKHRRREARGTSRRAQRLGRRIPALPVGARRPHPQHSPDDLEVLDNIVCSVNEEAGGHLAGRQGGESEARGQPALSGVVVLPAVRPGRSFGTAAAAAGAAGGSASPHQRPGHTWAASTPPQTHPRTCSAARALRRNNSEPGWFACKVRVHARTHAPLHASRRPHLRAGLPVARRAG